MVTYPCGRVDDRGFRDDDLSQRKKLKLSISEQLAFVILRRCKHTSSSYIAAPIFRNAIPCDKYGVNIVQKLGVIWLMVEQGSFNDFLFSRHPNSVIRNRP